MAMSIVGTPYVAVHFSRSIDFMTRSGSNFSRNTIVEPWFTQLITPRTQPKQWKSGTGMQTRSREERFWHAPIQKPSFAMLRWVSCTPLGKPVVPLVYCMLTTSFTSHSAWRARYASCVVSHASDFTSLSEYMPRCFLGPK